MTIIQNLVPYLTLASPLIGFFLFVWGLNKDGLWRTAIGGLLIFLPMVKGVLDPSDSTFRDGLASLSSVAVAIIAIAALYFNFRLRKDAFSKEKRDHKDQILKDITKWLLGLESSLFGELKTIVSIEKEMRASVEAGTPFENIGHFSEIDFYQKHFLKLSDEKSFSQYMSKIASALDEDFGKIMVPLCGYIEERTQLYSQVFFNRLEEKPLETSFSELAEENSNAIRKSIATAIDKSIEIRMRIPND